MSAFALRALANSTSAASPSSPAAGGHALQVVCAWPVSGQYGPGSRVLYYVLVATCVFARKAEWLRNACLAAALLFPAVAALHGIVLACVHVNGAVDMDIYGAFQLCCIGILAAPVTVRLSRTYFHDPGRNIIFLWTGLILAGLLSLTVEFYRASPTPCTHDDYGNPTSHRTLEFPYGNATCNLMCSSEGPVSPMRGGAANDIYVIPAPDTLSFNTGFLLAAACCIPAILSLAFTWFQILEINWKRRFGDDDEPIEGTNGATTKQMNGVNSMIRMFLSVIEVPLFGAAVLAILIIGEINFFSKQVRYQTEPIASIGQWAPIAGTVLAALGSLYLLLAGKTAPEKMDPTASPPTPLGHCNCAHHPFGDERVGSLHLHPSKSPEVRNADEDQSGLGITFSQDSRVMTRRQTDNGTSRRKVAEALTKVGNKLGTAAHNKFDTSEFKRGKARNFPMIPAEMERNPNLPRIREAYDPPRDSRGNATPELRSKRSRTGSFNSAISDIVIGSPSSPGGTPLVPSMSSPTTAPRRNTLEVPPHARHRYGP